MGEEQYRIIDINAGNIDEYGLLCLKSKQATEGYRSKVAWTKKRFSEGLRYKLLLVRERKGLTSRGFIEYVPGEYAWRGIDARGYMVIHCIWVVGQHKGHGYGSKLLRQCLDDAESMNGVAVVTTAKTWLPHAELFLKHGFQKVDTMPPYLELYAKRFKDDAPLPKFNPIPKERLRACGTGLTVFKADQCPYTNTSVRAVEEVAEQVRIPIRVVRVENCRQAQNGVHPHGTFCVLLDGKVLAYRPIGKKDLLEELRKTK